VRSMNLANRLVMPPMAAAKADPDGKVSQALLDYYDEKSSGGHIASIIIEHSYITPEGKQQEKAVQWWKFMYLNMVPKGGLEPPRDCSHCALNAARLPVPPLRHACEV
jgi:hypothetical protein